VRGKAVSESISDSAAPARPPRSISLPNCSQSGEKGTFLVHECARTCISREHGGRKPLHLNAISLALNVHKKRRTRLV
jgi:hypothetical protein